MVSPVVCRNWSQLFRFVRFSPLLCIGTVLTLSLYGSYSDRALATEPTSSRKSDLLENYTTGGAIHLGDRLTMTCDTVTPLVQHALCPIGGGFRPGESWFTADQLRVAQDIQLTPYQAEAQPEQLTVINATF